MTGAEAPRPGRQARQGATLGQSSKRPQEQGTPRPMSRVKRARSRVSLESAPDPDPLWTPSSPHRFLGASEVAPSFLHRGRVTQNVPSAWDMGQ